MTQILNHAQSFSSASLRGRLTDALKHLERLTPLAVVLGAGAALLLLAEAVGLGVGNLTALILPILLLQSVCLAVLWTQTTQRRAQEQSLRENWDNMKFAAKASKLVLWSWDLRSSSFWQSDHSGPVLRSSRSGTPSKDWFKSVHPTDRVEVSLQFSDCMAGKGDLDLEYRIIGKDGRVSWVKTVGRAEVDASGTATKLTGVTIDITRRKNVELEAGEQREILTHAARVGVLGELSGAIAHELSQPLAAILSNAQAAQRLLTRVPRNEGELHEIIDDIISDNNRARDVITHLRTLLKKGKSKSELLDVNDEVRAALALAHSELIRRRVDVALELGAHLPRIPGDRIQLEQALLNLILNAAEAINATQDRGLLTITTALDPHLGLQIAVRDNGPGLNEETMSHLFEPFFSTKEQGLGLGLAICNSIVAAHEGRLTASNNPDGGATFFISFPGLARQAA